MLSGTGRRAFIFGEAAHCFPEAHTPHLLSVEIRGHPLSPALERAGSERGFSSPRGCCPSHLLTSPSKACLSICLPSGRFSHLNPHHARLCLALHISHTSYTVDVKTLGTSRRFSPSCAGDRHSQHRSGSRAGLTCPQLQCRCRHVGPGPSFCSRSPADPQAELPAGRPQVEPPTHWALLSPAQAEPLAGPPQAEPHHPLGPADPP